MIVYTYMKFKKLNKVNVAPEARANLCTTTLVLHACNIEAETFVSGKHHIECIAHVQFTSFCFRAW